MNHCWAFVFLVGVVAVCLCVCAFVHFEWAVNALAVNANRTNPVIFTSIFSPSLYIRRDNTRRYSNHTAFVSAVHFGEHGSIQWFNVLADNCAAYLITIPLPQICWKILLAIIFWEFSSFMSMCLCLCLFRCFLSVLYSLLFLCYCCCSNGFWFIKLNRLFQSKNNHYYHHHHHHQQ